MESEKGRGERKGRWPQNQLYFFFHILKHSTDVKKKRHEYSNSEEAQMCGGTQQIETLKWQKDSGTEGSSHTRCEIFICVEIGFFHNMHPICMINVTGQKKKKKEKPL